MALAFLVIGFLFGAAVVYLWARGSLAAADGRISASEQSHGAVGGAAQGGAPATRS